MSGVVQSGLVLNLDTRNPASFLGEPTTNLIATYGAGAVNSIPSVGNTWGTYHILKYNNNSYFSIGTISDVTNNVVTTAGTHTLNTYDILTPQTTGGGVTAGTEYFVKAYSTTTFSLFAHTALQDGSISLKTLHTDIINDTNKISVSLSGFPTMWWGPPHRHGSGIVKEVIPNGFNVAGQPITDCMRLYFLRKDTAIDGFAYGVTPLLTGGVTYRTSFWARPVNILALGKNIGAQNYNYWSGGGSNSTYLATSYLSNTLGEWQRYSWENVPTQSGGYTITYIGGNSLSTETGNGPFIWEIAHIQIEEKNHDTTFVAGTRSGTDAWRDRSLQRRHVTLNGVMQESEAHGFKTIYFPYTDGQRVSGGGGSGDFSAGATVEVWMCPDANPGAARGVFEKVSNAPDSNRIYVDTSGNLCLQPTNWDEGTFAASTAVATGVWTQRVIVYYPNPVTGRIDFYKDGQPDGGGDDNQAYEYGSMPYTFYIGTMQDNTYKFKGHIAIVRQYNRPLTAAEVLQNFNYSKAAFGL